MLLPPTTVVEIENTHNRSGGTVFPQDEARGSAPSRASTVSRPTSTGPGLWNAAVCERLLTSHLSSPFDLVSVAFSKGLGAPVDRCWLARAR